MIPLCHVIGKHEYAARPHWSMLTEQQRIEEYGQGLGINEEGKWIVDKPKGPFRVACTQCGRVSQFAYALVSLDLRSRKSTELKLRYGSTVLESQCV